MATLKEVAEAAGVSSATASRILNQDPALSVQPATRQKVLEVARQLQYSRPPKASAAAGWTLGLLQWFSTTQEMEDTYYLSIRQGIEAYCQEQRIPLLRAFKQDLNYIEGVKQADAILCIGRFSKREVDAIRSLCRPVLFLDMPTAQAASSITLDFEQAVTAVLDYLCELGHQSIGFLSGVEYLDKEETERFDDPRRTVFLRYCRAHGIRCEEYLYEGRFSIESGYEMMDALLKGETRPTAVFAASDPIAIGAMRAIQDHGLQIPKDMSIAGFNDISLSAFTTPPLTTVHAPSMEMGRYGAAFVKLLSDMEAEAPMKIQLPCKLIVRESCTSPPDSDSF